MKSKPVLKTNTSIDKILADISENNIAPVYLIFGDEEFLIKKHLNQILDLIVPEESRIFNLITADPSVYTSDEIIDFAETYPFLSGKKVILINDYPDLSPAKNKNASKKITQAIEIFEKGEEVKSVNTILLLLELDPEDAAIVLKKDFIDKIEHLSEELLSKDQISILDKIYIFINENSDLLSEADTSGLNNEANLREYIKERQSDFSCFIFVTAGNADKRTSFYKTIAGVGSILEFSSKNIDTESQLNKIKAELAEKNITLRPLALKKLTEKAGINIRQIYKEIDKLIDYVGDNKVITADDIDLLVSRTESEKIFELCDALADKNADKALLIFNRLIEDQFYPPQILASIVTRFRFLYQIKLMLNEGYLTHTRSYPHFKNKGYPELKESTLELLPAEKRYNVVKQHPYVIFKTLQQTDKFTFEEITSAYSKLLKTDFQLKFSRNSPKTNLELLIIELC